MFPLRVWAPFPDSSRLPARRSGEIAGPRRFHANPLGWFVGFALIEWCAPTDVGGMRVLRPGGEGSAAKRVDHTGSLRPSMAERSIPMDTLDRRVRAPDAACLRAWFLFLGPTANPVPHPSSALLARKALILRGGAQLRRGIYSFL